MENHNTKKLWINCPEVQSETALLNLLKKYGNVTELLMKSGYAFVTYPTSKEAENAMRDINRECPLNIKAKYSNAPKYTSQQRREEPLPQLESKETNFHDLAPLPKVRNQVSIPQVKTGMPYAGASHSNRYADAPTFDETHHEVNDEVCYACEKPCDGACEMCGTRFCSVACMKIKKIAVLHSTFCGRLVQSKSNQTDRRSLGVEDAPKFNGSDSRSKRRSVGFDGSAPKYNGSDSGSNVTSSYKERNSSYAATNGNSIPSHEGNSTINDRFSRDRNEDRRQSGGFVAKDRQNGYGERSGYTPSNERSTTNRSFNGSAEAPREPPKQRPSNNNGSTEKEGESSKRSPNSTKSPCGVERGDKDKADNTQKSPDGRSPIKFITVCCMVKEKDGFWVISQETQEDFDKVVRNLKNSNLAGRPAILPTVDMVCAAPYEGEWCRARIISLDPPRVHYVDYGNTESVDFKDLRGLPPALRIEVIPEIAYFIRFLDGPSVDFPVDSTLEIRHVSERDDAIIVERRRPAGSGPTPTYKGAGVATSPAAKAEKEVSGSKVPGTIATTSIEKHVDAAKPVHDVLTTAVPPPPPPALANALRLVSGSKVILTHAISSCDVYITSVEEDEQIYGKLHQEVARSCLEGAPLAALPTVGSVVGAKYIDCFFRAKVQEIKENKASVFFMDFGNTELVAQSDLRELPPSFHIKPPAAIQVKLKDVPTSKLISPRKVLDHYIESCTPLILRYTNAHEGVEFATDSGTIINTLVKSAITELPVVEEELIVAAYETPLYTLKLNLGSQQLVVLNIDDDMTFYCCAVDSTAVEILEELPEKLQAIYPSDRSEAYKPRAGEVCAAKDQGENWARAVCVVHVNANTINALFIDYGNRANLDTGDLRKLPLEYQLHPALANRCEVTGLDAATVNSLTAETKGEIMELRGIPHDGKVLKDFGESLLISLTVVDNILGAQ